MIVSLVYKHLWGCINIDTINKLDLSGHGMDIHIILGSIGFRSYRPSFFANLPKLNSGVHTWHEAHISTRLCCVGRKAGIHYLVNFAPLFLAHYPKIKETVPLTLRLSWQTPPCAVLWPVERGMTHQPEPSWRCELGHPHTFCTMRWEHRWSCLGYVVENYL